MCMLLGSMRSGYITLYHNTISHIASNHLTTDLYTCILNELGETSWSVLGCHGAFWNVSWGDALKHLGSSCSVSRGNVLERLGASTRGGTFLVRLGAPRRGTSWSFCESFPLKENERFRGSGELADSAVSQNLSLGSTSI